MKLSKFLMVFFLALSIVACSNGQKTGDPATSSSESGFAEASNEADFIIDSEEGNLLAEDDLLGSSEDLLLADEVKEISSPKTEELSFNTESSSENSIEESSFIETQAVSNFRETSKYTVKKGDTLMLVAFKLYGDYRRWRTLKEQNPGLRNSALVPGTELTYSPPARPFSWNPQGRPHLVRTGDTLVIISQDKYGTPKHWKDIWKNNEPLILDPNLIFAGFTIYYLPKRDLASDL